MKQYIHILILFLISSPCMVAEQLFTLTSPDGTLTVRVEAGKELVYSVYHKDRLLIDKSAIALIMNDGTVLGENPRLTKKKLQTNVSEHIISPFYKVNDFNIEYNQLDLTFKQNFGILFRAYDDGVAYQFYTTFNKPVIIKDEKAEFNFDNDYTYYHAYTTAAEGRDPYAMAFQNLYSITSISGSDPVKPAFLPVSIDYGDELKVTILESDLEAYPGMFLTKGTEQNSLKGIFAPYPARMDYHPWRSMTYVAEREDYIASVQGKRKYPWRILAVTDKDTKMPVNHLVYALASPNRIGDYSWVKPGLVAWEWWNDWGISGVDFKAGINMDTYKYYIDFASENGVPYIILDEGWYNPRKGDILNPVPAINLEELISYGKSKEVGIILWAVFNVLDDHLEEACKKYSQMGIYGFKVDFLDRDDQTAVEMVYRLAEKTAEYKLLLDLHGLYKPTGLNRTYPHIINFESLFGMEEMKWSGIEKDMMQYDVIMPYIRMMAGPVDYTPGAMRNAGKRAFKDIYSNPMSQGTRCHQLAAYIVHDSPLTMLADNPTIYRKEQECTDFITAIPTTGFEETRILAGKMGEFIVTARRVGNKWYVGGMTNWDEREVTLDFSFLEAGKNYQATLFRDGINADKQATDYKIENFIVSSTRKMPVTMMPGGGFALLLEVQ